MTIREGLSLQFGVPIQNMTFMGYLSYLNSNGKISQRSLLDLLILICEQVENQEKREAQYIQNFKDIEDILKGLVSASQMTLKIPESDEMPPVSFKDVIPDIVAKVEYENKPSVIGDIDGAQGEVEVTNEEAKTFPCDKCDKVLKSKIALLGHSRSHK